MTRYRPAGDADRANSIVHLRGVPWFDAPVPPTRHRCWPQTSARWVLGHELTERCACGAIRFDRDGWLERNQRAAQDYKIRRDTRNRRRRILDAARNTLIWLTKCCRSPGCACPPGCGCPCPWCDCLPWAITRDAKGPAQ